MSTQGGGLNALPGEILCKIFQMALHGGKSKQSLCRIMLVCRQWREYMEGTASFWTSISAQDGLATIRRALELSKGAMLNLYWLKFGRPVIEIEAFMAEVGPHIARWRSLMVGPLSLPALETRLAPLTTTQAPNLEILDLFVGNSMPPTSKDTFTLFGGAPAPSTLKQLRLNLIPVAIEPLKLSGLVSLHLYNVPTITTTQLFEILLGSPSLETLSLGDNSGLVNIGAQVSNIQPIELPKLKSLSLTSGDCDGAKCIFSNIRIPNRRSVLIRGAASWANATSVFFTPAITHLLHTTNPTADFPSSVISVWGAVRRMFKIKFRGIEINLFMDANDRVQEILRWLVDGLGSEAAECPVHLTLEWTDSGSMPLVTVPPPLIVKHLSILDWYEWLRKDLYIAMAWPSDLTAPGWLYPQLESLSVLFKSNKEQVQLVSMLRSRYEVASVPGEAELSRPASLRSVELRGSPRTEGLVEEIKGILREANVFWAEEETP